MSSVSVDSNKLKSLIGAYYDRRMLRILLLGVISGFPWVLIASALSLWLKEEGLSRSTIGWAGLIFGVYLLLSTTIFIIVFHTLLAVSRKQLVRSRSTRS